jgi:hypothetical protein
VNRIIALNVPNAIAPKKARNDKKLRRQQQRAAPRADNGTPEPTVESEPRET